MKMNIDQIREKAERIADKQKDNINLAANRVRAGAEQMADGAKDAKQKLDVARLKPVFLDQIKTGEYQMPNLIHIVESDKRQENPVCIGSIGFEKKYKDMRMLTIYESDIDSLGLRFSSVSNNSFYYIYPFDNTMYIDLDEYFDYLKKQRVAELEQVAHALGAKHFRITLKEEKTFLVKQSQKGNVKAKGKLPLIQGNVDLNNEHSLTEKQYANLSVAAESFFDGSSEPVRPELKYYRHEQDIQNLIDMRLNGVNAIQSKTYTLKYNSSAAIKEQEAAKIDYALKSLGCTGNASVTGEVQRENRTVLEYLIEF